MKVQLPVCPQNSTRNNHIQPLMLPRCKKIDRSKNLFNNSPPKKNMHTQKWIFQTDRRSFVLHYFFIAYNEAIMKRNLCILLLLRTRRHAYVIYTCLWSFFFFLRRVNFRCVTLFKLLVEVVPLFNDDSHPAASSVGFPQKFAPHTKLCLTDSFKKSLNRLCP